MSVSLILSAVGLVRNGASTQSNCIHLACPRTAPRGFIGERRRHGAGGGRGRWRTGGESPDGFCSDTISKNYLICERKKTKVNETQLVKRKKKKKNTTHVDVAHV